MVLRKELKVKAKRFWDRAPTCPFLLHPRNVYGLCLLPWAESCLRPYSFSSSVPHLPFTPMLGEHLCLLLPLPGSESQTSGPTHFVFGLSANIHALVLADTRCSRVLSPTRFTALDPHGFEARMPMRYLQNTELNRGELITSVSRMQVMVKVLEPVSPLDAFKHPKQFF